METSYYCFFHLQVKEKHQPIFPANDIIITSVITFIKSLADPSNLPWIARQVFRSEKVNLAEITDKLEKAVEHYSTPSTEETAPQSPGIAPGNTLYFLFYSDCMKRTAFGKTIF